MSRIDKFIVWASATWLVTEEAISAHRTPVGMLTGLLISLCFLAITMVAVGCALTEWKRRRWRATIPLSACFLAVALYLPLGHLITRAVFAWSLPSYEQIVSEMEAGHIEVSSEYKEIRQAEPPARLAYGVFAVKDANGRLTVEFLTESGFPALHSGYLYSSTGAMSADLARRWPIQKQMRSKWFYISN